MNRSILIIIVDFLLISLLAFSNFDEAPSTTRSLAPAAKARDSRQDMLDVLKLSLDKERESREQLNEQLKQAQAQLQGRELTLSEREKLIREAEQMLREKAEEAARLARERAALQQQFATTQSDAAKLREQLNSTLTEASQSRQHLEAVRTDLQAREQEEAILKRKLAELEKSRQTAEEERHQLNTQLRVAEAERELVREQLDLAHGEVQAERQEKAKLQEHATQLAQGVSVLAEKSGKLAQDVSSLAETSGQVAQGVTALEKKSGELTQEIRENRPLAPNTVFNEFVANRVRADFRAVRSGVFGREVNKEKEAKSVLVRQGGQVYAIYHVNDTPLSFSVPGVDWDWLIGNIRRGNATARIERISFLAVDPRVVVVPVSDAKAKELGSKIYSIPKDPFKFQEAILVGANEGYYGECRFQVEADNPQYVRMQKERFSWLVGKFAPTSGDLVFTKQGDLLGVMVNKDYCLLLTEFSPAYHIQAGIGIGEQQTGLLLAQLFGQITRMPPRLQ